MSISVLFFGATAEIAGKRCDEMDLAPNAISKNVFDQILNEHPCLAAHKLHFSVNQEFATGAEVLKDGDELAIFTAVSGG